MLLKHHPDKAGRGEAGPLSLRTQGAFTTLSDPAKRRAYDSQCDFDDAVPSGSEPIASVADFLSLYRPVFQRNARFSNKKPVPELGDAGTPADELHRSYAPWHNFDSWRDSTHVAEHGVGSAGGRDEERWVQQQNAKEAKADKEEVYKATE